MGYQSTASPELYMLIVFFFQGDDGGLSVPEASPPVEDDQDLYDRISHHIEAMAATLAHLDSILASQATVNLAFLGIGGPRSVPYNLTLDPQRPINSAALLLEAQLRFIARKAEDLMAETRHRRLLRPLQDVKAWATEIQDTWMALKAAKWKTATEDYDSKTSGMPTVDTSKFKSSSSKVLPPQVPYSTPASYFDSPPSIQNPEVIAACICVIILNVLYNTPREVCEVVLDGFRMVDEHHLTRESEAARNSKVPKTIQGAFGKLHVDPILHYDILCPRCGTRYFFDSEGGFPERCSSQDPSDAPICGEELGMKVRLGTTTVRRARLVLVRQTVAEWLGRMLARPGKEKDMDERARSATVKTDMEDIWDSPIAHAVPWPTGGSYAEAPASELRLLFSVGIDWFSAHHGAAGKKQWSVGAIYLVCLNLPPAVRQRPENICFLCVIPGPRKPSNQQLNHILEPLVDEFLTFWTTGVKFTRTAESAKGRLVYAFLLLLVADLDACRALAGFNHYNCEKLCSYCDITKSTIKNINVATWVPRDSSLHRREALKWKDATSAERDKITKRYGLRYSTLLRLPYWDPVLQVVPEPMHMIQLGLLKRHCREIWQMDVGVLGGDGAEPDPEIPFTPEELTHARDVFEKGKSLKSLSKACLFALCSHFNLIPELSAPFACQPMIDALTKLVSLTASSLP